MRILITGMGAAMRPLAVAVAAYAGLLGSAYASLFEPETFTLDNGLQVVLIENHRVPAVTQVMYYRVGGADEPPGKSGIAHFVEHMMFRGTEAVPPGEFSRRIARTGGRDNGFTSQDATGYLQVVSRENLEMVMEMEADRMTNLLMADAEIEPERGVVLEERRTRVDNNPGALLGEAMRNALFMNHPYGIPLIGWQHEIEGISRWDMIDFYRTYYAPNNAILLVAGAVTRDELEPLVEKYYGPIPARPVPARDRPQEPDRRPVAEVVHESDQVEQPVWQRLYLAPSVVQEPETAYALEVLMNILAGGEVGRFYQSLVVDQRIASSAGGWYNPDTVDHTTIGLYASPRAGGDLDAVAAAMLAEVRKVLDDGVTEEEVATSVQRLTTAAIYALDDLQTAPRILGQGLVIGQTVDEIEAWTDRIAAVEVADVERAAQQVLGTEGHVTGRLLPASGVSEAGADPDAARDVAPSYGDMEQPS